VTLSIDMQMSTLTSLAQERKVRNVVLTLGNAENAPAGLRGPLQEPPTRQRFLEHAVPLLLLLGGDAT